MKYTLASFILLMLTSSGKINCLFTYDILYIKRQALTYHHHDMSQIQMIPILLQLYTMLLGICTRFCRNYREIKFYEGGPVPRAYKWKIHVVLSFFCGFFKG